MRIQHQTKLHFVRGANREKKAKSGPAPVRPAGRVPRVARLLALAHRFERLIQTGVVTDYADLAQMGHVTRARVTQIMNLLALAPDIQEQILCWPPVKEGKDPFSERGLRAVVGALEWRKQRQLWTFSETTSALQV